MFSTERKTEMSLSDMHHIIMLPQRPASPDTLEKPHPKAKSSMLCFFL